MMYSTNAKSDRRVFYGLLMMFLGLCIVRSTFQINIPQIVLLGIAGLLALMGDRDEIVAMCICCIPLHNSFEFSFAVLAGLCMYVLKCGRSIRFNLSIVPICLMVLWEIVHCFGKSFALVQFGGQCVPLLLLALLMCVKDTDFDYPFIVRAMVISTIGMGISLIGKMFYAADYNLLLIFVDLRRLGLDAHMIEEGTRVIGGEINPNTLGIICVLGFVGLMQIRFSKKNELKDVYLMVSLITFGVMTASRAYLVCMAIAAVLLLFSLDTGIGKKIRFLIGAVGVIILFIILSGIFFPELLANFSERFRESDGTGGRWDLMVKYHEFILSSLYVMFIGIGLNDFWTKVVDVYQVSLNVPHNGIQELIVHWGVPGLLLFAALLISMFVYSRKNKHRKLLNHIPLVIILAKIQLGQMFTSNYTMLAFSFAYLSMCADLTVHQKDTDESAAVVPAAEGIGIDFWRAVVALWRAAIVIAVVSIGSAAAGYGIARFVMTPQYQSSAMFYANNSSKSIEKAIERISYGDIYASRRLVQSYGVILKARDTLTQVIEKAGVDRTYEELKDMIMASIVNETEVFRVTVTSDNPSEAEKIANAIAVVLPERVAEIVQGTSVRVVDYAIEPWKPSSPNKTQSVMLGFMFGFVLIVMILLLRAMMDATIRDEEDLVGICDYPMLAMVPDLTQGKEE